MAKTDREKTKRKRREYRRAHYNPEKQSKINRSYYLQRRKACIEAYVGKCEY